MGQRPTALFAANDEMAISFLKTVHDAGLRVPRDVSIVGFDGIEYADFCEPPLTTLRQPRRALGAAAATALVDLMTGRREPEPRQRLAVELLVRGTSGPSAA
jgi:LacI family repressor for deo operon, udp, cdd, tsx, nupC, and nupG